MKRRLFVLSQQDFGPVLLGPAARQLDLAKGGPLAGTETILVGRACSRDLPEGVSFRPFSSFRLSELGSDDALVVSAYMPGRWLFELARSGRPFHADLYCVTATEILPGLDSLSGLQAWLQRWRRVLRYANLCARAETVYVSSPFQTTLLGGMFFGLPGRTAQRLAFDLPSKTVVAPIAPSTAPFPRGGEWPYPPELRGKPVFLWGGGIWKWFDVPTAIEAFSILRSRGSDARLFFLSGRNPSSHVDQDEPHLRALELARAKGVLGRNVLFNDKSVSPTDLPAYLEHCHAGLLSNGVHLESAASWRTRQLDLLWAGRPGVVSGDDPLSRRMAESGAAWIAPARDPEALARAVEASLDPASHERACAGARALASRLGTESVSERVAAAIASPGGFRGIGTPSDPLWRLRYLIGF